MAINNFQELRGYVDYKEQARHLKHGYMASVTYVDTQVGRLMDKLEELGILDNTIVVLWGDHGWKLGEHGSWQQQNCTTFRKTPWKTRMWWKIRIMLSR